MIPFTVLTVLSIHLASGSAAAAGGSVAFASASRAEAGVNIRGSHQDRWAEPSGRDRQYPIAAAYVKAKDHVSAQALALRALDADPGARLPFLLAALHEEMGHPFLALSVLKEASRRETARRESLMEMARIYCALGQEWPALDCYLRAADLGEGLAVTGMVNVGKRLLRQGDVDRANGVFALVRTAFPHGFSHGFSGILSDSLSVMADR